MNRARVNPAFARQEKYRRGEDNVDPHALELFLKFREYRPHLKSRLERILKDGRERELHDEVEDIKFYLSVMTDMLADENHGADAIQSFIDRIHEMIRKNPLNDMPSSSSASNSTRDDEEDSAPRSPSPEIIDSYSETPSTARTIPLEREAPQYSNSRHVDDTLNTSVGKRAPPPKSPWDLPEYDDSSAFLRRGSYKDVDMRSDVNCQPISNTRPAGRGSGVTSSSSYKNPWEADSTEMYNNGSAMNNNMFGDSRQRENSFNRPPLRDDWVEPNDWQMPNNRRSGFEHEVEYDHRNRSLPRDYGHGSSGRGSGPSQDYSAYGGPNYTNFDRRTHDNQSGRGVEESMFDRRPPQSQFERRERPTSSANRDTNSSSIQFDYNHGSSGRNNVGQPWVEEQAPNVGTNMNYSTPVISQPTFTNPYEIPQQQIFLNHQMGYPGPQPVAGFLPGMNAAVPNSHLMGINAAGGVMHHTGTGPGAVGEQPHQAMGANSGLIQSPGASMPVRAASNFQIPQSVANNRPGLLPTPPVTSNAPPPNLNNFGFRNPNGPPNIRPSVPRPSVLTSPNSSSPASSSSTSLSMSEISKQKAQQCFSQGRSPPSIPPRPRIATNQMVSERDPRLLNRLNPAGNKTSPHGSHTSHASDTSKRSLNDTSDDRRSTSNNSSDRLPRDPRGYQRDDRSRDRDRGRDRDRDRDREGRDRDRDSRDRNTSSNGDPRHRNDRDGVSCSQDPRHASKGREEVRGDKTPGSDSRPSKSGSQGDKPNDRHRLSDDTSSLSRDRSSKAAEDDASAKRLEEVRNRVRANMVQPKAAKPLVPDRLQEIRKQAAKEGYLTLGGKPVQKKQTNFEDAISSHNETTSSKSSQKSGKKDGSREKDIENSGGNGAQNKAASSKNKVQDTSIDNSKAGTKAKRRRIVVFDSDESDGEKEQQKTKKGARQKTKGNNASKDGSKTVKKSAEAVPPKKPGFRIPKIKRPEPSPLSPPSPKIKRPEPPPLSPPSPSPSPVPVEPSSVVDEDGGSAILEDGLTLETRNLVVAFVRESVPSEADTILNNPDSLNEVIRRLKEQVKQMYTSGSSTVAKSSADVAPDESIEVPSQSLFPEETADATEEPGSHRSRSVVKKKNSKRRSSLEKLHDALKEMRFDTMLPLGPRRCTRGPAEETATDEAPEPVAALIQEAALPNATEIEKETEAEAATTTGGKRGRKRKRKTSVVKVNKKKKGPVTRAKAKPVVQKSGETKKKAIPSSPVAPNSGEGRVTRSRTGTIGRNSIVTNLGLGKVKVESDYIAPKEEPVEPEDLFASDCFPAGDGLQHMMEQDPQEDVDLRAQVAPSSHVHLTMPSFSQDSDDVVGDLESNQGSQGIDQSDFQRRSVNPPAKKLNKRRVKEEHESPSKSEHVSFQSFPTSQPDFDTNYETSDLSFLPDLPVRVRLISSDDNLGNHTINQIYSKINNNPEESEETIQVRSCSRNNSLDCDNLVDWMVSTVETQKMDDSSQIQNDLNSCSVTMDSAADVLSSFREGEDLSLSQESIIESTVPVDPDIPSEPPLGVEAINFTDHQRNVALSSDDDEEYEVTAHHDFYRTHSPGASDSDNEAILTDLANVKGRVHLIKDQETKTTRGEPSSKTSQEPGPTNTESPEDDLQDIGADSTPENVSISPVDTEPVNGNVVQFSENNSVGQIEPMELADIKPELDGNLSDDSSGMALMERVRGDSTKVNLEGANLYICANEPCRFTAVNGTLFKDHITSCIFTPETKTVRCYHCDKRVKTIPHLLEHIKIHGHQKQFCSLCEFKTWTNSELTRHMKTHHKVYNFKVVSVDRGSDEDPDFVVLPKEVAARALTLPQLQETYARHADRLVFSPDDIAKIPMRQIFHTLAYCSLCSYSTKVRVNFCRHLQMHKKGQFNQPENMPIRDPVNPVPCLERQEMMFDKMTNWAGSSHAPKIVTGAADKNAVPQFVLEQFRYVCSEIGCGQITTDEYMLRTHMKTLHPDTENYACPHCSKNESTRDDPRNSVVIDKLGNHLKLHGPKLYRCAHCDFINTLPTPMEKHLPDKHPEKKPIHYLIRNLDANGESATRRSSVEDGNSSDKWRCSVCNSKTQFPTYDEAKNHGILMHRVAGQFLCADCRFSTDSDLEIRQHVLQSCARKTSPEGKIFVMWIRTDYTEANKPDDSGIHGPIWKRTPQSVKHIRGIFLEESREKSKSSSEGAAKGSETPKESKKSTFKLDTLKDDDSTSPFLMKCPKCNIYKTKIKRDMIVHLHNEMSYQRYRCVKCDHKFITENSLKGHVTGDHGIPYNQNMGELLPEDPEIEAFVYKAMAPDFSAWADLGIASGLPVTERPDATKSEGNFKCKHCPQEFQSGHNLRTHLLARHLASNMHVCKHCKQGFWNKKLAKSHHERHHKNLVMQIHHDLKLEKTFTPSFWMEEYGITVREEKKLRKEKDDSTDDSESPLKRGTPLHTYKPKQKQANRRIVFCANCEYECDNPTDLENHMATHKDSEQELPAAASQAGHKTEVINDTSQDPYDFSGDPLSNVRVEGIRVDSRRSSQTSIGSTSTSPTSVRKNETHCVFKCYHCKDNFLTVRATRTHWQKIHSRRPEERCNYYQFKTAFAMDGPTGKMAFQCFVCDQGSFDFNAIITHHLTLHKELPFRLSNKTCSSKFICEYCKIQLNRMEEIQTHMEDAHQNLPPKYYATDLQVQDSLEIYEPFGKLVEDSVRFMCMACKADFATREEHREHISLLHADEPVELTAGLKFQSHILNSKIQVPGSQVQLDSTHSVKYKCPVCEYVTVDKEEMTSEHLTNHLYIYLCPLCPTPFQTVRDAKFHLRHSHGDSKTQPGVNEDAVAAFKLLEDVVEEVQSSHVSAKPQLSVPDPLVVLDTVSNPPVSMSPQIIKSLIPNKKSNSSDGLTEEEEAGQCSKNDDQVAMESETANPGRSEEAGPGASSGKGRLNTNVRENDLTPASISPKPSTSSAPGIPMTSAQDDDWMENFVNINPIAPELIEIPGVGSDQWAGIDLADYSGITEEDPFMSTGWGGWEGKN